MIHPLESALTISTDRDALNIDFIHSFLTNTYWAKGRTIETMKTCIDHSLNVGVYLHGIQIGYARIVSDFAQFAYLMDVFIIDEHRGKGYSSALMQFIMQYEDLKEVKIWRLATTNAHFLYQKFGFKPIEHPEKLMELIK